MYIADELQKVRKDLDAAISTLNELEKFYSENFQEYATLKFQTELASAVITREELAEVKTKKKAITEVKEKIKARLMMNRDYQELIKLETSLVIAEKRFKVAKSKVDALKLKYDLLKL